MKSHFDVETKKSAWFSLDYYLIGNFFSFVSLEKWIYVIINRSQIKFNNYESIFLIIKSKFIKEKQNEEAKPSFYGSKGEVC